jgi:hypothetical protein
MEVLGLQKILKIIPFVRREVATRRLMFANVATYMAGGNAAHFVGNISFNSSTVPGASSERNPLQETG